MRKASPVRTRQTLLREFEGKKREYITESLAPLYPSQIFPRLCRRISGRSRCAAGRRLCHLVRRYSCHYYRAHGRRSSWNRNCHTAGQRGTLKLSEAQPRLRLAQWASPSVKTSSPKPALTNEWQHLLGEVRSICFIQGEELGRINELDKNASGGTSFLFLLLLTPISP